MKKKPDIVIVGYNEMPFENYLSALTAYGKNSEAYRDLRPNFFDIDGKPNTYIDLLNGMSGKNLLSCDIPNLAAVYLSDFLIKRGISADFINLFQQEKQRLQELLATKPLCVAITTTFYVTNLPVIEMVQFIRKCDPLIPIVIGGVLVSNHFNAYCREDFYSALEDMGGDIFVLESQGELTLYNLVVALRSKEPLPGINNIVYIDESGEWVMSERKIEQNSIDDEAIDWSHFTEYNLGNTLQTRTARSCAFACAFCGYPERGGPLTSARIDTVARELETMKLSSDVKNVVFIDDTFNVPKGRFKDFCRMLIDRKLDINWFSYYRCDHGDEEAIELMSRSGCKGVFLGIESGSQEILEKMNKRAKIVNYQNGIKQLKAHGILTFASFITGYPGETEATAQETIDFIRSNRPDYWRTMLWYCDPLTPVYKTRREEFNIKGHGFKWSHYTMSSMQAADLITKIFLSIDSDVSVWLPQYSFDFWIIPYLMGKGISLAEFRKFMALANQAMVLELQSDYQGLPKQAGQRAIFDVMKAQFSNVGTCLV